MVLLYDQSAAEVLAKSFNSFGCTFNLQSARIRSPADNIPHVDLWLVCYRSQAFQQIVPRSTCPLIGHDEIDSACHKTRLEG